MSMMTQNIQWPIQNLDEAIAYVNAHGLRDISERIERKGEASGAQRFYKLKVAQQELFDPREVEAARYILERYPRGSRICEPGIGFGQFVILLALLGYPCVGIECHDARYEGALELRQKFVERCPELAEHIQLVYGFFPKALPPGHIDLVVTTNFVHPKNNKARWLHLLTIRHLGAGLVDVKMIGRQRHEEDERQSLLAEFGILGLEHDLAFGSTYHIQAARGRKRDRLKSHLGALSAFIKLRLRRVLKR